MFRVGLNPVRNIHTEGIRFAVPGEREILRSGRFRFFADRLQTLVEET